MQAVMKKHRERAAITRTLSLSERILISYYEIKKPLQKSKGFKNIKMKILVLVT